MTRSVFNRMSVHMRTRIGRSFNMFRIDLHTFTACIYLSLFSHGLVNVNFEKMCCAMFMPLLPLDFSVAKSIFEYILNIYGVCFECFSSLFICMLRCYCCCCCYVCVCVSYFLFRQLLQFFSFLSIIFEIFFSICLLALYACSKRKKRAFDMLCGFRISKVTNAYIIN